MQDNTALPENTATESPPFVVFLKRKKKDKTEFCFMLQTNQSFTVRIPSTLTPGFHISWKYLFTSVN